MIRFFSIANKKYFSLDNPIIYVIYHANSLLWYSKKNNTTVANSIWHLV